MLRKLGVLLGVSALVGLSVVGCSRFGKEQRAEWRSQAEAACLRAGLVKESQFVRITRTLEGPGSCGADYPVKVAAFAMESPDITASVPGLFTPRNWPGGLVTRLNQEGTLTCPMYSAVHRWLEQVVQPSAMARFGQPVVELRIMGTYSCRRMNNGGFSARMSEHAYANAIDVGGFRLQDGSLITVLRGWNGPLEEQNFLREVHAGACTQFATVLGPGVAFHHDHLHMDLARHGRRGDRSICRPYPEPVSPPNEGFPVDPAARSREIASARERMTTPRNEAYAYAPTRGSGPILPPARVGTNILPAYRPSQLPLPPRNPVAEREQQEFRAAPPRQPGPAAGAPILLYGQGKGPFLPLKEHEIDKEDLDEVTGSVGE
ncbi:MAG: extensin family protein [Methylocystis sp.]|nr:extensin family protein [Methylocystis sp.]MCA3582807.1 extensin family protein [Methylocystis sp.]MCA3586496.1 extensin family protein [Methylocystis sp.]MCA3592104.1 extensin family protein [Methylocystis sp.]